MRYVSLFSGIEAATVAWEPLGWTPLAFAEIDTFPSAVLAHRYPHVPNLGDVTKVDWEAFRAAAGPVDVVVFGSPCQSFSIAGKRLGLDDPRGNLALHALGVVRALQPRYFVFENVPGLLSSGHGRDFGQFLATVGDIGYQCAWRVLDAQYFGLAQRRRRVFVVGHLGDWRRAAAVLFERASVSGHPAPSRETGAVITAGLTRSIGSGGADDNKARGGYYVSDISHALTERYRRRTHEWQAGVGVSPPPPPSSHTASGRLDPNENEFIAHAFDARQSDVIQYGDQSGTLDTDGHSVAVAFHESQRAELTLSDTAGALTTGGGKPGQGYPACLSGMAVRRLTPRECCRLQGFPDDYLDILYRGKPAADGPKYKALGNSMAVPVVRWIGRRIQMVDAI